MFEPGRLYVREWSINGESFVILPYTPLLCIKAAVDNWQFSLTFLYNEKVYTFRDAIFSLCHWKDAETGEHLVEPNSHI